MSMLLVRGTPASPGAAIGPAWTRTTIEARPTGTPAEEIARVIDGLNRAAAELAGLVAALAADGHAADAEIVETNRMMATDQTLVDAAIREAQAGLPAAEAIARAVEPHARALDSLDDPMLAARAADLRSVGRRAADLSLGVAEEPPPGSIVVADDLGPGEVASWAGRIAAIVLAGGGTTAHAAIVARSLHVPLVTAAGEQVLAIGVGEEIGIDADRGLVWRHPDVTVRARIESRMEQIRVQVAADQAERHQPVATTDGRVLRLLANAGTEAEVLAALDAGADGIGLLRSELAFLDAQRWPTEQDHLQALEPLLRPLANRIATVRTLDFGADKTPPFLAEQGVGGLLGARGIRLALATDDGVEPQLRALLRVAGDAVLRILVPMVTETAEVDAVREAAHRARDIVAPGAPDPLVGAMIEVPAAALNARAIAKVSDFLSIGTNDLVQYTLAADRQDPAVASLAVAHHPAVIRLIARVVSAAHGAGIPVDVCGEAGGDPELLPLLVGLGVDELSVSPSRLAATRRMIRSISLQRARIAATAALDATTPDEVAAISRAVIDEASGEVLEQVGDRLERV
jgi:phosphocarrier protein FPr/phosphocarrier protein